MNNFIHRLKSIRNGAHVQLLHLHFCAEEKLAVVRRGGRNGTRADVPFWVSVPVLSLNRYSILPSSSGNVLVLTIAPGISGSFMIWDAYTVFPISKFTRRLSKGGVSKSNSKSEKLHTDLIGMMDENKIKNLKTYTYHSPRKPLRATSTSDRAKVTAHKI